MATAQSAESGGLPTRGLQWAALGAGLAAAWTWVVLALQLGDRIDVTSIGKASAEVTLLLFGPLALIALGAGRVGAVPVWRGGTHRLVWTVAGVMVGAGGVLATLGLSWINGGVAGGAEPRAGAAMLALGLALTLLQTGAEEITFRGWLQPALTRGLASSAGGLWLGAVLFALFHLAGGARDPLSVANIVLAGVVFGLLARASGGLWAPLAAHFAWNLVEDNLLGLVPNPGVGDLGAVFDLDLVGAVWWGGGEEGLNASIGTTAVLLALSLVLAARVQRDRAGER